MLQSHSPLAPERPSTDTNRILYNYDCLEVLNDEVALPSRSVDLIYADPPSTPRATTTYPSPARIETPDPSKPSMTPGRGETRSPRPCWIWATGPRPAAWPI